MTKTVELMPPLTPQDECSAAEDRDMLQQCINAGHLDALGIAITTQLFSYSENWGPILRLDFELADRKNDSSVNRVVCWRKEPESAMSIVIAIGQEVPFLNDCKEKLDDNRSHNN